MTRNAPEVLVPPADITLFAHQSEAIRSWAKAGGRGVLEMATGSGKTITGLSLASRLYDDTGAGLAILIVAPLIHLVDQWREVARLFGLDPIRCAESRQKWQDELSAAIYTSNRGRRPVLSIAATAATLAGPSMQALLAGIRRPLLIIADEMHNYGADNALRSLPANATYRLGLSATPDRWMDESGTHALKDYFGPVVFRYGLSDAIRAEVLTRYRYFPELVDLEPEETEEYLDLTRLLARYVTDDLNDPRAEAAKRLLIKRARLIASARKKFPRLRTLLDQRRDDTHILVYCGDGRVEGAESEETVRQIEEVVRTIGVELGMTCASYTAETAPERRRQLLRDFSSGLIQVLVAIRCLDEGVDVPETRTAYILASSTNPRQFIQRRGRVLRRAPGKSRAEIFDFFVAPPTAELDENAPEFSVIRKLFGQQIRRAREFAELAENGPVARPKLLDITSKLRLLSE
jgi:DNA phosphorothioation system restriction enzyme